VLQKEMPKMEFFNYADKRFHYVTWVAPPCGNLPSQYYNWSVGVPEALLAAGDKPAPVPLELSLHRDGQSYWRTQFRMERQSIVVSPHDFPTSTWWYGYHESLGTLKSFRQGIIQPYTERRLLAFVDWAARKWPIDRNKILVAGCRGGASGSGALHLGLRHPDVFALVVSGHGLPSYAETAASPDRQSIAAALGMQAIWGNVSWAIKTDAGASVWEEHDMTRRVAAAPAASVLPLVALTSDNGPQVRALHRVCLESGRPLIAEFSWGGTRYVPVTASETFPNAVRLDVRQDAAVLAFSTPEAVKSLEGGMGEFGGNFTWRDVSDTPQEFQVTLLGGTGKSVADITFRQLQQFKVAAGKMYHWAIKDLKSPPAGARTQKPEAPPPPTEGDAMVGDDGLLRIKGISLPGEARLTVGPK